MSLLLLLKPPGVAVTTYALDAFGRTESNGWGTADVGGAWTVSGTASDFSVGSGIGTVTPTGASRRMALASVSALDTNAVIKFRFATTSASSTSFSVASRVTTTLITQSYRGEVEVNTSNQLVVRAYRNVGGASTQLDSANKGAGSAATWYWLRVQVEGTSPTTIRARVWADGAGEPGTWDVEATDSEAALQGAGFFQIGNLNANKGTWDFDDLNVASMAAAGQTVTPPTASLTTATFAPTVAISDNQRVTVPVAAMTTTRFAPTVVAPVTVTVPTAALTTTTFAPVITAGAGLTITPPTALLSLTAFAPTATVTNHQRVVVPTASLVTTQFAPTVSTPQTITVPVASLTTATFAPTVAVSDHQRVVVPTASLTLTSFAPTILAGVRVTVPTANLVTTAFAPSVSVTADVLVTVPTAALALTTFAPTVTATGAPAVAEGGSGIKRGRAMQHLRRRPAEPKPDEAEEAFTLFF